MTKTLLTFIALFHCGSYLFGQDYQAFTVKLVNETGEPISVTLTHYDLDTIQFVSQVNFANEKSKTSPGYFRGIRLDIVAVLGTDTIFSKSIKHIDGGRKTVYIKSGSLSVEKPLQPKPHLRVTGSNNTGNVLGLGDYTIIKLHSKGKVRGYVQAYDKSQLTIRTKKGEVVVIEKGNLKAFRERDAVWSYGPRFSLFPYFKFTEIEDIEFQFVRWDENGGTIGQGGWEEIK